MSQLYRILILSSISQISQTAQTDSLLLLFFNPLIDLIPLPKQILRQILSLLSFCGVTGPVLNTVNRKPNLSNPSRNKSIRHSKMAVSSFLIHHFLYYNILPRTVMNIYVISINMFSVSSVCFILLFQWICSIRITSSSYPTHCPNQGYTQTN